MNFTLFVNNYNHFNLSIAILFYAILVTLNSCDKEKLKSIDCTSFVEAALEYDEG